MEHYYSKSQKSIFKPVFFSETLLGNLLKFHSGSGVFSIKKVDKGSALLIGNALIKPEWRILDLGCGYGPIGLAIAKKYPNTEVVMTDINKRAVALTKKNIKENNIKNASVIQGHIYEKIEGKFDTILLNPPQTAGKQLCFEMIESAKDFLKNNGILQIVARHQKGGKHLAEFMKKVFNNVEEGAKGSGYRIYTSKFTSDF